MGVALSFLRNFGILSGASGVLGALSSGVASAALDDRFAVQRAQQKQVSMLAKLCMVVACDVNKLTHCATQILHALLGNGWLPTGLISVFVHDNCWKECLEFGGCIQHKDVPTDSKHWELMLNCSLNEQPQV